MHVELTATADAMATTTIAGIGGAVFFPNGSCHWFQFQLHLDEVETLWDWVESDMQKHIAAWELLAQFALTACINDALPSCRGAIACTQGTDNSAADAASAKGLSMTPAVATILAPFYTYMRRNQIYPKITHIPGHLNDIADALSRFKQPLPEPLSLSNQWVVRWQTLLDSASIFTAQTGRKWPNRFGIGQKWFLQSPLTQGPPIDSLWGFAPAGRFSIFIGVWYPPLHLQVHYPVLGMYICAFWGVPFRSVYYCT